MQTLSHFYFFIQPTRFNEMKARRDVGYVKKFGEMCGRVNGVSVGGVGKCAGVRV